MYNSFTYGTGFAPTESVQDDVSYGGFGLKGEKIYVSRYREDNILDFDNFANPLANGRGFIGYYKRGKRIGFDITIKGDDVADFQNNLDNLRRVLFQPQGNLDIRINGVIRRIKAVCISNPKAFEHYNIDFIKTTVEFETLEPFFYEVGYQSTAFLDKTADFFEEVDNQGSDIVFPLVVYIFKTGTALTGVSFERGDEKIIINETFTSDDVLIINGEAKTVTLNGVEIDYDGVFPYLGISTNFMDFEFTGTVSADITILNRIVYV